MSKGSHTIPQSLPLRLFFWGEIAEGGFAGLRPASVPSFSLSAQKKEGKENPHMVDSKKAFLRAGRPDRDRRNIPLARRPLLLKA